MMRRLGFNEVWISRVMTCVTTVSYAVLVNGQSSPRFIPTRDLWQNDPISPYFYLICTDGLSSLLNQAKYYEKIKSVKVARGIWSINHIFFVNNSIVFCRGKISDWQTLQEVLDTYVAIADQGINKHKTRIFFNSNTNRIVKRKILTLPGVTLCNDQEKYLSLPMMVGRNRYKAFDFIRDKVWNRINNWKNIFLSQVNKEILLKSVVQAVLTYVMSMFKPFHRTCKDIGSQMSKLWWNHLNKNSSIHWRKWKLLGETINLNGV